MALAFSGGACAEPGLPHAAKEVAVDTLPLVITEVAQSSLYDGSTSDKVEVYCGSDDGCAPFRICDSTESGRGACSAQQAALGPRARVVVARGSSITDTDLIWLADDDGNEVPGTRLGPIDCPSGQSRARADCSAAPFAPCSTPDLGSSSGTCSHSDVPEPFTYSLRFATNQHGRPESTCDRPACQDLFLAIQNARQSIDFAIYGIRAQPMILHALLEAQARGVIVRGVVDSEDADASVFGYADTRVLMGSLLPGSVVSDIGSGYGYLMHNKFFVFDHETVWTGSTNLSDTELGGEYNSDVAVLIELPRLAAMYGTEFQEMFHGRFHHHKTDNTAHVIEASHFTDGATIVRSYFSPTDNARDNAVIPLIAAAKTSLDIAMFYFTSQEISDAVLAAMARGVAVRLVLDAGGASSSSSKHGQLCSAGAAVRIENWGGKSHSKWAVADATTAGDAAVVFGSMNWTGAGNDDNDDNTLYVRNDGLAAAFHDEFERQWSDLADVPWCSAVSAEGADSSSCGAPGNCAAGCTSGSCCDGIDNDFDGRVDLQEEACGCADGIDNDGDGYVDADDWDCRTVDDP